MFFAGSDTRATALASCLHLLSMHPAWQVRLCAALHSNPDPPVHGTLRVAPADDAIPLGSPVVQRDGSLSHARVICKGTFSLNYPEAGNEYVPEC